MSGYHADNVAPCILGGIVLVAGITVDAIRPLPVPDDMHLALVTPDFPVPTSDARAILPKDVSLRALIHQTGKVAQLVTRCTGETCKRSATRWKAMKSLSRRALASCLFLRMRGWRQNGRAPSLYLLAARDRRFAPLCDSAAVAERVAREMNCLYAEAKMGCIAQFTQVDRAARCAQGRTDFGPGAFVKFLTIQAREPILTASRLCCLSVGAAGVKHSVGRLTTHDFPTAQATQKWDCAHEILMSGNKLYWDSTFEIVLALMEAYPDIELESLGLRDLSQRIVNCRASLMIRAWSMMLYSRNPP